MLELPYVGSGVLASALAMNKRIARVLFERAGLPVAKGIGVGADAGSGASAGAGAGVSVSMGAKAGAERARREVGGRLVVKPSSHGSAIGVTRLEATASARRGRARHRGGVGHRRLRRRRALRAGARGHVRRARGRRGAVALPPTEILSPNDPFYTYEARYAPGRSVHVCPAKLPPAGVAERVQVVAVAAHRALGCRDLSRADFIVGDEGDPDPPSRCSR